MARISVDMNTVVGPVRPLHGINNAPLLGANDKLFHYLGEAGIPFSRLHDTGGRYGGGSCDYSRYVDERGGNEPRR